MALVITAKSKVTLKEILASRNIIKELIRRDFNVRYKQTVLGFLWAVINPGVNIIMFLFVFGLLIKVPTPEYNAPYAAVLICGILFWNLFSGSMLAASDAIINNMHLVTKVYFPRIALCIASVFIALIDFLIAVIVFVPIALFYNVHLDFARIFYIIPCMFITLMLGCGVGCLMAVLKLRYRDLRHILPLATQALFFASPIVYTLSIVPDKVQVFYILNPITGIVTLSRWSILGGDLINAQALLYSFVIALIIVWFGVYYLINNDHLIADYE